MTEPQVCILVLGMHRSGTSALTRLLSLAGARLPMQLLGAGDGNELGHWEPARLISYHDKILSDAGSAWHDWGPLDLTHLEPGRRGAIKRELLDLIEQDYDGAKLFVIKDPRICRFAPLFMEALSDAGITIAPVVMLRNPLEVMASLEARDSVWPPTHTPADAALLWLRHVIDGEATTRNMNRSIVTYEGLLENWRHVLTRIADSCRISFPYTHDEIASLAEEFLRPDQRHQASSNSDVALDPMLHGWVSEAYTALQVLEITPSSKKARADLDDIRRSFQRMTPTLKGLANVIKKRSQERIFEIESALETQRQENEQQVSEVAKQLSVREQETAALQNQVQKLEHMRAEMIARCETAEERAEEQLRRNKALQIELETAREESARVASRAKDNEVKLQASLNDKESVLKSVRAEAKRTENEAKNLLQKEQAKHAALRDQIEEKDRALDEAQLELDRTHDAYRTSTSWKMMAPLRGLKNTQILLARLFRISPGAVRVAGGVLPSARKAFRVIKHEGAEGVEKRLQFLDERQRINKEIKSLVAKDSVITELRPLGSERLPWVTVIVPNYNHGRYLRQRLDSIYKQTYEHFDVILLDDCSTDNSLSILREYESRFPEKTRLIENTTNSGSGYRQWTKGLREAEGGLIWIAESDDWCEADFLETLAPLFVNESLMLAYVNSAFMNEEGTNNIWCTDEYLSDIDPSFWHTPFERTAHQIVAKGWAYKNIVPNVSSAVFRNPKADSVVLDDPWTHMKICGDWQFYLQLIRGGTVAYRPERKNYYRVHSTSTAKSTFSKDVYYKEHESVARFVVENFDVTRDFIQSQEERLKTHWKHHRQDYSEERFASCYRADALREEVVHRKPSILMATYAFAAGGGETFPIFLANLLKSRDYSVTFLSCEQEPREQGVRQLLRPDIPVVTAFEAIENIIETFGIDIVHSHHAWVDSTILDLLPLTTRAKTIVTMHGMYEGLLAADQERLVKRLIERSAAIVWTACKNLAPFSRLDLADHSKLFQVPNALPEVPINPVPRSELGVKDDAFLICLVSRAIPEKGWDEAIQAVALARKSSQLDIQLLLIGEGPEYDRLRTSTSNQAFTHFIGFQQNLRDYYATSDLGFLPSRFSGESFPLTLIDCLAAGTPFLASDVGEIRPMVDSDSGPAGQVFRIDNWQLPIEEMARMICTYAARGEEYLALLRAVPAAYEKFEPDHMVEQYEKVYLDAMRG